MSKFIRNVSVFLASLPLLLPRAHAAAFASEQSAEPSGPDAVPLRPLNLDVDNQFASHSSHSSHSSHASHSSHYSGSGGGGYVAPAPYPSYTPPAPAPDPTPAPAPYTPYTPPATAPAAPLHSHVFKGSSPASRSASAANGASSASNLSANGAWQGMAPMPSLSQSQKLKLQIMRVQIRLSGLGLYKGRLDGVRNPETIAALKQFQAVKGLPETGMMSTPTLNALGVPAS